MKEFKPSDKIELKVGGSVTIKKKLGEGGLDIVYLFELKEINTFNNQPFKKK